MEAEQQKPQRSRRKAQKRRLSQPPPPSHRRSKTPTHMTTRAPSAPRSPAATPRRRSPARSAHRSAHRMGLLGGRTSSQTAHHSRCRTRVIHISGNAISSFVCLVPGQSSWTLESPSGPDFRQMANCLTPEQRDKSFGKW